MKRLFSLSILFMVFTGFVSGQEVLTGLQVNPQVKQQASKVKSVRNTDIPLALPFFDDFNRPTILPNPELWSDADVFISDDYAVYPPTVGVATFDAINNLGRLYENASQFPYQADFLTSQPIRLDSIFTPVPHKITRADSIYFSFYYQPQGRGNAPAAADSLVLEFLAPGETTYNIIPADTTIVGTDTTIIPADTVAIEGWIKAWSSPGASLSDFYDQDSTWFKQVIIPVADSARFYMPDFRFRFRNYASLAGGELPDWQSNGDQWNVDYVYLNTDRGIFDSVHRDVAFAARAPRMLKNYTSMPYSQYRANFIQEMTDTLSLKITNLDKDAYNATYRYEVSRDNQAPFKFYDGGSFSISPFITSGYVTYPQFAHPPVNFQFPVGNQEKVFFTTTHIVNAIANLDRKENDTIRNVQVFANYYAYDDGTAEAGYGIAFASAQVAYRFKLNTPDSLLAVDMYFNQTLNNGNVKKFYLNIWNDYFGEPGDLIYSKFGYEPVYTDSLNQFFMYKLDSTVQITETDFPNLIFYVGWEQVTADNLNIGFDMNNNAQSNIFKRITTGWSNSLYEGALMIRPVIGKEKVVGIPDNNPAQSLLIYPNPTYNGLVKIQLPSGVRTNGCVTSVFNTTGKMLISRPFNSDEDFSILPSGLYFIQVTAQDGSIAGRSKLLVNQ